MELSIDPATRVPPVLRFPLYKQCGLSRSGALDRVRLCNVAASWLYGMAKLIHVVDVALDGECVQPSTSGLQLSFWGADGYFTRPKPCLPA